MRALAIGALVVALTAPIAAQAAPQCDRRDAVLQLLEKKYKESVVAIGVTSTGALLEILATNTGSTWSAIVTTPQGMSCMVSSGEGWQVKKAVLPGEGL